MNSTNHWANIYRLALLQLQPYQLLVAAISMTMILVFGLMMYVQMGYLLAFSFMLLGSVFIEHLANALHIEIELLKVAAPRANRWAIAHCILAILLWSILSCLPLLSLARPDRSNFYLACAAAAIVFFRTSMIRLQEPLSSKILNVGCAILAVIIWLLEVNPIWLWALAGLSLLTLLPLVTNNGQNFHSVHSKSGIDLSAYFPFVGRLSKLLNIRPFLNLPVLGVAAISMAWLLIQPLLTPSSKSNPGMPLFGILEALILVNGCNGAFTLARRWIRQNGEQQLLSVFPTIASVEIRTTTIWRQMTILYVAIAFAGIAPRLCAALLYPSLILQSNRAPTTLILVGLAAVELALITLWIHARALRTRSANGEEINPLNSESALVQSFTVVMVALATTSSAFGPLVPAYVVIPLFPVALFLVWWERQNWLNAPEPLWQNNVGGQTR